MAINLWVVHARGASGPCRSAAVPVPCGHRCEQGITPVVSKGIGCACPWGPPLLQPGCVRLGAVQEPGKHSSPFLPGDCTRKGQSCVISQSQVPLSTYTMALSWAASSSCGGGGTPRVRGSKVTAASPGVFPSGEGGEMDWRSTGEPAPRLGGSGGVQRRAFTIKRCLRDKQ